MQYDALWRTTTFRLTLLYGLIFLVGVLALLGLVYDRSEFYLTQRVDGIVRAEAEALAHSPRDGLRQRIAEDLTLNGARNNIIALFSADGARLAGNLAVRPPNLTVGAPPLEIPPPDGFPTNARLIELRLPTGELLVVGRDIDQLQQLRTILASALVWSGLLIIVAGLGCGVALSIAPLRRLRSLQSTGEAIAKGDLERRMPTSHRHDELDMLAGAVNSMMGEVQRLMAEIRGATETIAHDLITPLTRASTHLRRIQQSKVFAKEDMAQAMAEVDEVLDRFRAILRISELQTGARRAGFCSLDLAEVIESVSALYQPLAEADGVWLSVDAPRGAILDADPKLLVEAVSNLVDNAIKFTGRGGTVQVRIDADPAAPRIVVEDNGPGIPESERLNVLQRFYRGERHRMTPGSGLGLSVVAAIVHLHGFELVLEDAGPGLRATIHCHGSRTAR